MKSLCIKTNNSLIIHYLLEEFEKIKIENAYLTLKEFHHFQNIILHYKNDSNITPFIHCVSNILTKTMILFFEKDIIKSFINLNYFYFNLPEKNTIEKNTFNILNSIENYNIKYDYLNNKLYDHLLSHHSVYLREFLDFQVEEYIHFISEKIDFAVNKFLIDKEYLEFVNILRLYISSESSDKNMEHLHLIYHHHDSIIIDDHKNIITCNDNIAKAKYISDISFSSNDLALNTLLNLLPQKITVHLIDSYADEFINTLKLIFQDRIKICEDCDICHIYRFQKIES